MNKELAQELIGPLEESHTEEQSPKAVLWMELWARRKKMAVRWARTRVWVVWWFFLEEDEVCGSWNKWRGPRGAHEAGGAPRGVGAPGTLVARCWLPLVCSQCQIFLNNLEKIIFHFRGIWRTFIFGVFIYCKDNSKTDRKYYFCFI